MKRNLSKYIASIGQAGQHRPNGKRAGADANNVYGRYTNGIVHCCAVHHNDILGITRGDCGLTVGVHAYYGMFPSEKRIIDPDTRRRMGTKGIEARSQQHKAPSIGSAHDVEAD